MNELRDALDEKYGRNTKEGQRGHSRNVVTPADTVVPVEVRGKNIMLKNTKKCLDVWVPKEGNEGKDALQWILDQISQYMESQAAPSQKKPRCPSQGPQGQEEAPREGGASARQPTMEEAHRIAIIKAILKHPRCDNLLWLPSRQSFRLQVAGMVGRVDVKVVNYLKLKKDLEDGGSFRILKMRYDDAQDKMEALLSSNPDTMRRDLASVEEPHVEQSVQEGHREGGASGDPAGEGGED